MNILSVVKRVGIRRRAFGLPTAASTRYAEFQGEFATKLNYNIIQVRVEITQF